MKALLDLSQLAPGQRARVLGVTSQGAMRRRLQELGLLAGAGGMLREKPPGRSRRLSGAGRCDRTAAG